MCSEIPRQWRFAWEAQSHTSTLKLFLFDLHTKPSIECKNLNVQLINLSKYHLLVNWVQDDARNVSLRVPIPKVLIDPDSPLSFRALDDHIQVKLVLLLPVDHPIFSDLSLSEDGARDEVFQSVRPLIMDSDVKILSSMEGVHFYCRSCSTRLTTNPLRNFVEMPSVNWREMADNWFGACCCSFGGISEKLVSRYAAAYTCARGLCLLNATGVTLCKDDLAGSEFSDSDGIRSHDLIKNFSGQNGLGKEGVVTSGSSPKKDASHDSDSEGLINVDGTWKRSHLDTDNLAENNICEVREEELDANRLLYVQFASNVSENGASRFECCHSAQAAKDYVTTNTLEVSERLLAEQKATQDTEVVANKRSFINGFLGDVFMAKSYNHSTDIKWKQFLCFQCSTLLGAYPCVDGKLPIDDGVRLFKCYLSTSLPVGSADDLFRKYKLERMFANQLMESAKDELSFRTVVKDLTTKSPMLQVVLVNPNSWCCFSSCSDSEHSVESTSKLELYPVIKLLFSDFRNKESQLREFEAWFAKNLADEVFMLPYLIEQLIETIASKKDLLPPSCTSFEGLSSSFLLR